MLWVGRDLETEEEIRMLFYVASTQRNGPCINIFMSQAREECGSATVFTWLTLNPLAELVQVVHGASFT